MIEVQYFLIESGGCQVRFSAWLHRGQATHVITMICRQATTLWFGTQLEPMSGIEWRQTPCTRPPGELTGAT